MHFNRRSGRNNATKQTSSTTDTSKNDDSNEPSRPRPATITTTKSQGPQRKKLATPFRLCNGPQVQVLSTLEPTTSMSPTITNRNYESEKNLSTKPPLPAVHHRPPTRPSSRNEWASTSANANNNSNSRPTSPLTRSGNCGRASKDNLFTPQAPSAGFQNQSKFQYSGPHQVYAGPHTLQTTNNNLADGPERLQWPPPSKKEADQGPESVSSISTTSREFHRSICQSISGFPLAFRKTTEKQQQQFPHQISKSHQVLTSSNIPRRFSRSHQVINDTTNNNPPPLRDDAPPIVPAPCLNSTEPCPFRAFLEETRAQNQNPLKSVHSSMNVLKNDTSNATNFSGSNSPMNDSSTLFSAYAASFPRSLSRCSQHQQTGSGNVNASIHSIPSHGPFVRSSVPDDIQDDLVRIELLMELRKYKRALSAQLEAQQRMIQMCNSGTITPPQASQSQHPCSNNNTQSCQLDQLPLLIGHYQQIRYAIEKIMDPFKIFSEEEKANQPQPPRSQDGLPQRPGTVWENDLEKHLNSDEFITSFNSHGASNQQNGVNGNLNANLASFVRDLQQNPTSVSLLRGAPTNTDEFQTARSLFPSGLMNDMGSTEMDPQDRKGHSETASPIIVRSRGSVQKSNYQFGDAYPANFPEKSIASPVEPTKESLAQRRTTSQFMGPTHQLTPLQSAPNEKNSFLGTLHSFPPAAFQLSQPRRADSAGKQPHTLETGQMIMLRKPVQISKNRSGNNYLSASPPQSTITTISHIGMEDRPSPFFPGVAGDRIDMRLRSPVGTERFIINRNDVEELGNLLSQLPVLSRKQKVEEFAFNTLKPPSPVTEAESETSMIPLASSLGTLTSRVTSSREDRPPTTIDNPSDNEGGGGPPRSAVDGKNEHEIMVDTDKMSIHELVTLGRKIYRILSQLSTACPNRNNSSGCSILPEQKGQTRSITAAVVDFNAIPNPTFVTGPGPRSATHSKSSPKVIPSTFQPPTPFKKIVQPPPTRWGEARSNSLNERHNSYRKMVHEPRSSSSIRPVSGVQTRTILKYDNNLNNNVGHSAKYTASYTVRNFNNSGDFKIPDKSSSKYNREDSDPYPVPPPFLDFDGSVSTGKSRSKRRNFIKENISKIRDMKRIPRQRLGSKRLPPVTKRFDHVQSTIGSTARSDRSSSLNRDEDNRSQSRQRSSSLPPNPTGNAYGRSPSPAPARSNILRSSSSKSLTKSRSGDSLMKAGRQRKRKETGHVSKDASKLRIANNSKGSKISSKTMLEESSSKVSVRKSRSKTKKNSGLAAGNRRDLNLPSQSSDSTIAIDANITSKKPSKTKAASRSSAAAVIGNASKKRLRQSALKKSIKMRRSGPDYDDFDDDGGGPPEEHTLVETTQSEQNIIKKIVKAEMDQLLDKSGYVMGVMKRSKEEKNMDYKSLMMTQHTDTESAVESENLTPVYSPPPYQDETLFSLENWINPEGGAPGTAYTSTKETPATTAERADPEEKLFVRDKNLGKPQTVRFSLPQKHM